MYVMVDETRDNHMEMSVRNDGGTIIRRFRVWKEAGFRITDGSCSEVGYARVYDSQREGPPERPVTWPG